MKKSILILMIVLLSVVILTGCLPEWLMPTEEPTETAPPPVLQADVEAVLVKGDPDQIAWSIENIGQLNIFKYIIYFDVYYPMVTKDNVKFELEGYALEIGGKDEGIFDLIPYDTPETVAVSWKLFE